MVRTVALTALLALLPLLAQTTRANPDARDVDGRLFQAIEADDYGAFTGALQDGADVNARDAEGLTPLMYTAKFDRPAMAETLIGRGADRDAVTPMTALSFAAYHQHGGVVQALLRTRDASDAEYVPAPAVLGRQAQEAMDGISRAAGPLPPEPTSTLPSRSSTPLTPSNPLHTAQYVVEATCGTRVTFSTPTGTVMAETGSRWNHSMYTREGVFLYVSAQLTCRDGRVTTSILTRDRDQWVTRATNTSTGAYAISTTRIKH